MLSSITVLLLPIDLTDLMLYIILIKGDCWICMELMDISLDQFYKFVYKKLESKIPEQMLGKISVTVSYSWIKTEKLYIIVLS